MEFIHKKLNNIDYKIFQISLFVGVGTYVVLSILSFFTDLFPNYSFEEYINFENWLFLITLLLFLNIFYLLSIGFGLLGILKNFNKISSSKLLLITSFLGIVIFIISLFGIFGSLVDIVKGVQVFDSSNCTAEYYTLGTTRINRIRNRSNASISYVILKDNSKNIEVKVLLDSVNRKLGYNLEIDGICSRYKFYYLENSKLLLKVEEK